MLSQLTITKKTRQLAFDREQLYAKGLEYVQKLSSQIWTDYNVHDPGITTLELLCYALTDLSDRASLPIQDLLASETNNAREMKKQFFTARQILPSRPLTLLDYRKLLIDIDGVKNAWLQPARLTYYADTVRGELLRENPRRPEIVEVNLAGLYEVKIQYSDEITTAEAQQNVSQAVQQKLHANRNLCEDFVSFTEVDIQNFQLCAELELVPDADVTRVNATILDRVQEYLSPSIRFYTLSEMLTRQKVDGTAYTVDEIFDGPALENGFIDDRELANADLRREIRLSDIISIIMDIDGVQAVRDIIINPEGTAAPLANKWLISVDPGKQANLNPAVSRLVFYKRNMPVLPGKVEVTEPTARSLTNEKNDLDIPLGIYQEAGNYYSVQNHFPAIYGLSEVGLSSTADDKRKALAYQLKAYLLFFDQIMANYMFQLSRVKELFSINPDVKQTYFYQAVQSFADYTKIYAANATNVIDILQTQNSDREKATGFSRRNRFLDRLIARFAERVHDIGYTMYSNSGSQAEQSIAYKCRFLQDYPTISSDRALAYDYSLTEEKDLWDSENVSGLEKRLAKLLGISNYQRRNLSEGSESIDEGMYLIENILLRPERPDDPFLPICPDRNCTDCADLDPYSYRIQIILPAYGLRFGKLELRRFAEQVIREETPAHILPKICWISKEDMTVFEKLYRDWIYLKAGVDTSQPREKLSAFIDQLFAVKNVYPPGNLHECSSPETQAKFILGRTTLGTENQPNK
ncbi:hypothetical protein [Pseudanabaena sp. PCC 6802]|uniref:hypothetical protein n=1 Tax=Pseudanabaena sp. PCC 6802 TaxID=118173 RepID=UPI00034B3C2B|nr:hypothetical protein [Pseudanabaena sp. PCC 6802]